MLCFNQKITVGDMMRILVCAFSIILTGILTSCSGVLEPDFSNYQSLAVSVGMNGTRQIVIVDCNDPSNYQIITGPEENASNPVYSPDKRYLSYFDHSDGFTDGGRLVLYDTYTGEKRDWIENIGKINDTMKVHGTDILWQPDSKGFYVYQYLNPQGHAHIDITKDEFTYFQGNAYPIETFVGYKNSETLIVRTTTSAENHGVFYYMNKNGEYLETVENPYLRNEGEIYKSSRSVNDAKYYPSVGLFVFTVSDTISSDKVICITNLDGSYFEVLTQDFKDGNPTLNNLDNVIYFERWGWVGTQRKYYPIMSVALDSKKVTEFFSITKIPGATDIIQPNY